MVRAETAIIADEEPLSIILMIGDGMGYEQIKLAQLVEVGVNDSLVMQQLMWNASVATFNINGEITDSAAAGTALATGKKTSYGRVGVLPTGTLLENIVEFSQTLGIATGIVSTCSMVHATPATFVAHVNSRSDYSIIANQIIDSNVDVLLAGGDGSFSSTQENSMASKGYTVVKNRADMLLVTSGKIFGLFAYEHMDYETDRDYAITPSLAEMTNKSIELLSQDSDGFFLMVEGGQIDFACHDNDKVNSALETIEFDKAVKVAYDYVTEHSNAVLIVTADHETGGLTVLSHDLNDNLPSALLTQEENEVIRIARVNNVTVGWSSTDHTNTPVPLYCYGTAFSGLPEYTTIDNTQIFTLMKSYLLENPLDISDTIAPIWSITPTNQEVMEGEIFSYQVRALDASGIEGYAVNNTMNFTISPVGLITNLTSLTPGIYGLNVSVWDAHDNLAFRIITITILPESATTTTGTESGTNLLFIAGAGIGVAIIILLVVFIIRRR